MITTNPAEPAGTGVTAIASDLLLGMRTECHLRDQVEAAYGRARLTVFDVRPHDQPGPLARSQQRALDDLHEAELSLNRFRRQSHPHEPRRMSESSEPPRS